MSKSWKRIQWKRILLCTLALAAALALKPASSNAQSYSESYWGPSWELTAFNGYYIASDLYTALNATIGLENSYTWGGRLGFYPNPRGGIEFSYTRSGSDLKTYDGSAGFNPGGALGRVNLDNYDVNFIMQQENLANPRVTGFFTLGFGWTMTAPEYNLPSGTSQPDGESFFAWNMGLGTKIGMSPSLALRLEGRWRITDTNITTSSGVYCDYWGYCYGYASDWYSSGELSAGLTYKLGRK
jgi:opacity protein-like surface antigen